MTTKKPTIAITGASGFLGGVLVEHFLANGWQVIALARKKGTTVHKNLEYRTYDITKPIPSESLADVDCLVHAAYIKLDAKNPDAMTLNITGADNLLSAAREAKVSHSIFMSTMSAHEDAISVYGKQKLQIETLFLRQKNTAVLRGGLIIGNGGIVKDMAKFMRTKHAVPLIGGGKQPLQIISVYDLAASIENVFTKRLTGRFVVANPKIYSYKDFYAALAKHIRTKIIYVPVPYWTLEALFKTAAALRISLGVGEDNLKGLKKLKSMPSETDMKKIGVKPMNLQDALEASGLKGLVK